jgi:PAS domain S-box-containing protein/diguanylate cyclase (GGDEF)-like protein
MSGEKLTLAEEQINETKKCEQLLAEYKAAVDASNIVSKTDINGIITYANQAFCNASGYSAEELIGKPQNMVRHPNMPKAVFKELWETITNKHIWKGVVENRRKDGSSYFVDATIVPILGIDGEIIEFLGIRHDITEFINNKQKLFTNSLTGLPNRYKLAKDLSSTSIGSLAIVNIDSFKVVNDFYGNDIGDFILVKFADRLSEIFGQKNFVVYKLSADEYAVFCENCMGIFADEVSSGLHQACKEGIQYNEIEIVLSVSAGISSGNEGLLEKANMALEFAKKNKKHLAVYDDSMLIGKNYGKNIEITKTIRDAIANDLFVPYFQPIVNTLTNKIEKYETLVRIVMPNSDVISPYIFLDVAKATKLYPHITKAVVTKSFEIFKNKKESFSINLSVEDILDLDTRAFIMQMAEQYGVADRLIFEILESEGIENYGEVSEFLCSAKKMGIRIAIDDFGTGYSNFEHISKLNVDIIKIDGSLIKNINTNKNSEIITETIVGFASKLKIESVAEFVHSKEVYDKIKEIGVDYAQGYYLGEPAPLR